ncbi:homoserine kinase [Neobacillus sp. D3-1R]|uniref:homoserine kinase n=1 Tax=Neobacillus sp. D3-1R TaxID=3445778 RepID=UPI003FA12815
MNKVFTIKVPASTANLGPGFDSIGIALGLFLTLEVSPSDRFEIISSSPELDGLPKDESHFIFQIAKLVSQKKGVALSPCSIKMESSIPLARGLGSSAAAIVAGIELANQLGKLELSLQEKLEIATEMEGHPDNVGASLYGGLVVGSYSRQDVQLVSFKDLAFEVVAFIPKSILLTKESRQVLPENLSFQKAVEASSLGNVLVASLLSKNWKVAGLMMERDLFHQPYRRGLIPEYEEFEQAAKEYGAFGIALSGAGPSILAFAEKGHGESLQQSLKECFPNHTITHLPIDLRGSYVY